MNTSFFPPLATPWERRRLVGEFEGIRKDAGGTRPLAASQASFRLVFFFGLLAAELLMSAHRLQGQTQAITNIPVAPGEIRIVTLENSVEVSPLGASAWVSIQTAQTVRPGDRVRTGPNGRAVLRWSDQSIVYIKDLTEIEILPPDSQRSVSGLNFIKGFFSFFHRDKPGRIRVLSPGAVAGIEGTEFAMRVDEISGVKRTTLFVIDGRVRLENELSSLVLTNGEQAIAEPGRAPARSVGFIANNVLQWCFYYPGVLVPEDLPSSAAEQADLTESLRSYRNGDLIAALTNYPTGRTPVSEADALYHAALLLSVGQVEQTENELARLEAANPSDRAAGIADALRTLIAAVKFQANPARREPQLATELLAASYYAQSRGNRAGALEEALELAKRAVTNAPQSGFAWERVAELEFSFGRIGRALEELNKSLELSPRNAQGLALKGFLLAAQNQTRQAIVWFDRALEVDARLANAWLGRGLCRIRRGDVAGGREDLLIAAALEPQRASLRSYLGKAYSTQGDYKRAEKELHLAQKLDPSDPTSWLYSALIKQQENRVNEAIGDLEKSTELNDNRSVYRSSLLLDQDRAVRSANLARIYQDAGMFDLAVREASRAVSYDYANYSAHLFLANSYDALRDPNRINLRYETPAESEYVIANLLSPVSAGMLSASISQQEYSKLFERDRLGLTSSTEYLSRGAWMEEGAQYGNFGDFGYAVEGLYRSDPGQRLNNDFESRELRLHLKQQLTPQDSFYLRLVNYDAEAGDVTEYYDPAQSNSGLRTKEHEEPILSLGYHHEWGPGIHTLAWATRLSDRFAVSNPSQPTFFIIKEDGVTPSFVQPFTITEAYHSTLEIYSTELQQILECNRSTTVVGARFQIGNFHTRVLQTDPLVGDQIGYFAPGVPAADQDVHTDFERASVYGYESWQIIPAFQLIGGVSFDWIKFPENFRAAPVSALNDEQSQISPKAGFVWTPTKDMVVRFAYTRSLAGASIDQTYLLEPSQVAGFNQSFRSILPESVGGAETGARFETFGLSLEHHFSAGTYVALSGEILNSQLRQNIGDFEYTGATDFAVPGITRNQVEFEERSLLFTLDQLIGKELSLGARYRVSRATLNDNYQDIPDAAFITDPLFHPRQRWEATLHQIALHATYNHPSGFFSRFQALWYAQDNIGFTPARPVSDFWQLNLFVGYRFPSRFAEIQFGLLNLTDQDYRLDPLTLYNELPRKRTLFASLKVSF